MLPKIIYFSLVVLIVGPLITASLIPMIFHFVIPRISGDVMPETSVMFDSEEPLSSSDDPITFQHFVWASVAGVRFTYHPIINWVVAVSGILFLGSLGWMLFVSSQKEDTLFDTNEISQSLIP